MDHSPGSDAMEWQLDTSPVILHQTPEPFHASSSSRRRTFDAFSDGSEPMSREPAAQHITAEQSSHPRPPQHSNQSSFQWLTLCIWHLITAAMTKTNDIIVSYKRRRSSPVSPQPSACRSPPRSRIFHQKSPTVRGHVSTTPITPRNLRSKSGLTNPVDKDHTISTDGRNFESNSNRLMSSSLQSEPIESSFTTPEQPKNCSPRSLQVRLMPGTYPSSPIREEDHKTQKQSSPRIEPNIATQIEQGSPSPQSVSRAEPEETFLNPNRSPARQFGDSFEDYEALFAINLQAFERHQRLFDSGYGNQFLHEIACVRSPTGLRSQRFPLSSLSPNRVIGQKSSRLAAPPKSILRSGRFGLATPVQRRSFMQGVSSFPRRIRTALGRRRDVPIPETVETPTRLRRSVAFAESPKTGRPVTATKRFYTGERIDHPSPGSSVDENSIQDVPGALTSNASASNSMPTMVEQSPHTSMSEDQAAATQLSREFYQSLQVPAQIPAQIPDQQATIADFRESRRSTPLHFSQKYAMTNDADTSAVKATFSSEMATNEDSSPTSMTNSSEISQSSNQFGSFSLHSHTEASIPSLRDRDIIANTDTLRNASSTSASPICETTHEPVRSSKTSSSKNDTDVSTPKQQQAETGSGSSSCSLPISRFNTQKPGYEAFNDSLRLSSQSPIKNESAAHHISSITATGQSNVNPSPQFNLRNSSSESVDDCLSLSSQSNSDHISSFDATESRRRFLSSSGARELSFESFNNSSSLFSQPNVKEGCSLDHSADKLGQQSVGLKREGGDDVSVEKIDDDSADHATRLNERPPSPDLPAAVAELVISPPRVDLETSGRRSSERKKRKSEIEAQEQARLATEAAEVKAQLKKEANEQAFRDGVRRKPKAKLILPLTPEADHLVAEALKRGSNAQVALTSTGNPITRRDIGKVLPQRGTGDDMSGWLNDEIITAYLQMVTDCAHERAGHKRNEIPKFHSFNPFFYTNLKKKGYEGVKRWANKAKIGGKNLEKVEWIFIPVNEAGNHWTVAIISPRRKTIEYFDSMHHGSASVVKNMKVWLKGELGSAYKEAEWTVREQPGFEGVGGGPTQDNARDCGVFAVTTAKMVALNVDPMTVSAADMPLQRRRMVAEMLNGGFSGAFEPIVDFD